MYKIRPSSKTKKISQNITKNYPSKKLSKKIQININNFLPISLAKSKSIVPFSSNTLRNKNFNKSKNSFDNLLNNQKSLRNSTIKNSSIITTIINPKAKTKSKQKRGISSQKPKINNMKNTSYLSNNEFIKNIVLYRRKNKNSNKNNLVNNSKKKSNSIRCSLTYINRYSNISKPKKPKIKYENCACLTSNNNFTIYDKKNKNEKWKDLVKKLEILKTKTNSLLNQYYTLSENLNNELEIINSNYDSNIFANSKSYDYRKKLLMYDKVDDEQLLNELIDNKYINTDINNG